MKVVDGKYCTGCTACANICPRKAIEFKEKSNGFLYPIIDEKLCIKCNKCKEVCPALKKIEQDTVKKSYAGWILDETIRMKSSSGGIFTAIAREVLNNNGYVCGASFNNNKVEHIIISKEEKLQELRGSKYVQSNLNDNNIFIKIKKLLEKNILVMFSGTPCQIAGLNNFLQKKYENLITVDIICHGVPSPKIFKEYIEQIEKEKKQKISKIYFRDKSEGWRNPQFVLESGGKILQKSAVYEDTFGRSFLTNMILRQSCFNCKYPILKSQADITLGDFWGAWIYKEELNDSKGVSLIITHTDKGEQIMQKIQDKIKLYSDVPLELAINNNYPIAIPSPKQVNSDEFFEEYEKKKDNIKKLLYKYLDDNKEGIKQEKSVGILNFHYENYNYGANLVAYSLMRSVEKMGYNAKIINYDPFVDLIPMEKMKINKFKIFRNNFLKMTPVFSIGEELYKLNNYFDTFIVGSDQVWRKTITVQNMMHYFFDFVRNSKNMISYGASFGSNNWEGNEEETKQVKQLLKRFKKISVREDEAIDICKETFDVNATRVLDPTLLLSKEEYQTIIDFEEHERLDKDYVAYYFLFDKERKDINDKELKKFLEKENLEIINIKGKERKILGKETFIYNSVSDWINYIKNCKVVITDSYHGILFSIIYNKPFICMGKKSKALSRFETLFKLFDIKENFFEDFEEINKYGIKKINYDKINKILNEEKKKSINFLKDALSAKIESEDKDWIEERKTNILLNKRIAEIESNYKELNNKYLKKCEEEKILKKESSIEGEKEKILEIEIQTLQNQNKILNNELNDKRKYIERILNSTSWKITSPIRKFKELINKFK